MTDYEVIQEAMEGAKADYGIVPTVVLSGKARGADTLGEEWAARHGVPVEDYPALWDDLDVPGAIVRTRQDGSQYNIVAGHQRNEQMAMAAEALVAIVAGTGGTADMLSRARLHKLLIYRHRLSE